MFRVILLAFVFLLSMSVIWILYEIFTDNESTALMIAINWKYRVLRKLREIYLHGLSLTPPNGYEFFVSRAIETINGENNKGMPMEDRMDLVNMVSVESYVHYYFVECGEFTGALYHRMWNDYRSGAYSKTDYSTIDKLRRVLPTAITSSERAFNDFLKFVNKGWFDPSTGMYILSEGRNHQYIGRAIYWICRRNGIPSPEHVFADFWGTTEDKIRGWKRKNENESITDQVDKIVMSILKE